MAKPLSMQKFGPSYKIKPRLMASAELMIVDHVGALILGIGLGVY